MMFFSSNIADRMFKKSSTGEKLFYGIGPLFRPYVVPDAVTEKRLYRKYLWMERILLAEMVVSTVFLFMNYPEVFMKIPLYFIYFFTLMATFLLINMLIFAPDAKKMCRAEIRFKHKITLGEAADQYKVGQLVLYLIGSLLFVAFGIRLFNEGYYAISIMNVFFFGLCAAVFGYNLYLKTKKG